MSEESDHGGETAGTLIPPYIPFQTLLTFLKQLKTDGLPPQIDKSVLTKFSGGTQNQLKVALKSLGLMDDNKPTNDLAALVEAYETAEFEPQLKRLLERTYPYVFKIDLMTATPTMFGDAFDVTGAKADVSRKCRTFFLHAAKRAGIPLGNRILTGSVPRAPSNGTSKRKARAAKPKEDVRSDPPPHDGHKPAKQEGGDLMARLLDKFPEFDPEWNEDLKAKWFAGFDTFMKAAKPK